MTRTCSKAPARSTALTFMFQFSAASGKAVFIGAPVPSPVGDPGTPVCGPGHLVPVAVVVFSQAIAGRLALLGWEIERGRPLAERADASTVGGRAQRGAAREREGAFEHVLVTARNTLNHLK